MADRRRPRRRPRRRRGGKKKVKFLPPLTRMYTFPGHAYSAERKEAPFNKMLDALSKQRESFEDKYDFAINYDDVQTPEGLPTFEEFVLQKQAAKEYNEADPLWGYTKMYSFGPVSYQRWRGAQTSIDGKNYRSPYLTKIDRVPGDVVAGSLPIEGGIPLTKDGKFATLGGPVSTGLKGYKKGHRIQMENRNFLDKVKAIPGNILPPLNMLSGGASASGFRGVPLLGTLGLMGYFGKKMYDVGNNDDGGLFDIVPPFLGYAGAMASYTPTQFVQPTGGFMLTPFNKQIRQIKKDGREEQEKIDNKLNKGDGRFYEKYHDYYTKKEQKQFERQAKLYEKKYGFLPVVPDRTESFTRGVRTFK